MTEPTAQGQAFYTDPDALADARAAEQTPTAGVPAAEAAPPRRVEQPAPAEPPHGPVGASPSPKPNMQELLRSLTGFDELAIKQAFGREVSDVEGTWIARICLFIVRRRAGASDAEAYRDAMTIRLGDLEEQFADDDQDGASVAGLSVDQALEAVQSRPEA